MERKPGLTLFLISLSCVYLTYTILTGTPETTSETWLNGYKIFFILAGTKSLLSYVHLELKKLSETIKQLQYSAIATTGKAEVLALCREERALHSNSVGARYSGGSFRYQKEIPFVNLDEYNQAPVFWYILSLLLLCYNTAHLACAAVTDASPLFFGVPAIAVYWGLIRFTQIILR